TLFASSSLIERIGGCEPRRLSIVERVCASSGLPVERKTSLTIDGTLVGSAELNSLRCSRWLPHSRHSAPAIVCWPQAQLRCSTFPEFSWELCAAEPTT